MENEVKNSVEELNDESLENVSGGVGRGHVRLANRATQGNSESRGVQVNGEFTKANKIAGRKVLNSILKNTKK